MTPTSPQPGPLTRREPVAIVNAVGAVAAAVVVLAVSLGFDVDSVSVLAAIGGATLAVERLVSTWFARAIVDSPETVDRKVLEGVAVGMAAATPASAGPSPSIVLAPDASLVLATGLLDRLGPHEVPLFDEEADRAEREAGEPPG